MKNNGVHRRRFLGAAAGFAVAAPVLSFAQAYPNRTVRVIVPFAAGGPSDIIARIVADALQPRLGQSVVDMTRGGRNGFFSRNPYPATEKLLLELGSPYMCLNTHMRNNGDWCPGSGVAPFKDAVQDAGQVTKPPGK